MYYYFLVDPGGDAYMYGNKYRERARVNMIVSATYFDISDQDQLSEVWDLFPVTPIWRQDHEVVYWRSAHHLTELLAIEKESRDGVVSRRNKIQEAMTLASKIARKHIIAKWIVREHLLGRQLNVPIGVELKEASDLLAHLVRWYSDTSDVASRLERKQSEKLTLIRSTERTRQELAGQLLRLQVQLAGYSMTDAPYGVVRDQIIRTEGRLQSIDNRLNAIELELASLRHNAQDLNAQGQELGYGRYVRVRAFCDRVLEAFH